MLFDLKPSRSFEEVKKLLEEVDEAGTVLRLKGGAPFGGLSDIRKAVRRAEIGKDLKPGRVYGNIRSVIRRQTDEAFSRRVV